LCALPLTRAVPRHNHERMLLNVRTWGTGPRIALLVHGYSDDSGTWWQVAPALADRGFTVIAPDLRGHGTSPRADQYALEDFAADLVETLPTGADLALGHSLGALVLALAAPALAARRTVLVDPPWLRRIEEVALDRQLPRTPEQLPSETAQWSAEDVAADLSSNALLDPRVGAQLMAVLAGAQPVAPTAPPAPGSLVVVPELAPSLPLEAHDLVIALGYAIRTVPGVRHVIHRDDLDGFLDALPLDDEVPA